MAAPWQLVAISETKACKPMTVKLSCIANSETSTCMAIALSFPFSYGSGPAFAPAAMTCPASREDARLQLPVRGQALSGAIRTGTAWLELIEMPASVNHRFHTFDVATQEHQRRYGQAPIVHHQICENFQTLPAAFRPGLKV